MTKREKALALTGEELQKIKADGGLPAVAQALGLSGRGTPDELYRRIKLARLKAQYTEWRKDHGIQDKDTGASGRTDSVSGQDPQGTGR